MKLLTTDIYEGAYLLSQGMQLEKLWQNGKTSGEQGRTNGKRSVVFEFTGPQVELLRKDYQKGRASANVLMLKQSLNELKDRMFNLMRTSGEQSRTTEEKRYEYRQPTIQIG